MRYHIKEGMGTKVLKIDLMVAVELCYWEQKNNNAKKTKYNPEVYDMLLLRSTAGASTQTDFQTTVSRR